MSLIKELGFEINILDRKRLNNRFNNIIEINSKNLTIPNILLEQKKKNISHAEIKEALIFNKNLLMNNFIEPYNLRFPLSRNILEKYYN